jgi:hypothetical protein
MLPCSRHLCANFSLPSDVRPVWRQSVGMDTRTRAMTHQQKIIKKSTFFLGRQHGGFSSNSLWTGRVVPRLTGFGWLACAVVDQPSQFQVWNG